AEALAITTILTRAEFLPFGIGVGARGVGGGTRERIPAFVLGRIREHEARQNGRQRRQRVFAGTRRFEAVAALLDLALDVAGLAGNSRDTLELVIIGLELVVGDAPVLDRH